MIYHTQENEVLDYICWKNYFQSNLLTSLLAQEAEYYDPAHDITGIFDIGNWTVRNDEQLGWIVNKVLDANPTLITHGIFLPSGLDIYLPGIDDVDTTGNIVQLWD